MKDLNYGCKLQVNSAGLAITKKSYGSLLSYPEMTI